MVSRSKRKLCTDAPYRNAGSKVENEVVTRFFSWLAAAALAATVGNAQVTDRLVVGQMSLTAYNQLRSLRVPSPFGAQRFCEGVNIGANLIVFPYLPTAAERVGDFSASAFQGTLLDPVTNQPFPGNIIPVSRIPGVMAWRIAGSGPAPGEACEPIPAGGLPMFSTVNYVTGISTSDSLSTSTTSFTFNYRQGDLLPAAVPINVVNRGSSILFYQYTLLDSTGPTVRPDLVTVKAPARCCQTPSQLSIGLAPAASSVAAGSYTATLRVTPVGLSGSPIDITLFLRITTPSNFLSLDQRRVRFTYTPGQALPAQTVNVVSQGSAAPVTLQTVPVSPEGVAWFAAASTTPTTNAPTAIRISLTQDVQRLGPGGYLGYVQASVAGAARSPARVAVELIVGSPRVSVTPSSATFNYADGAGTLTQNVQLKPLDPDAGNLEFTLKAEPQDLADRTWLTGAARQSPLKAPGDFDVTADATKFASTPPQDYTGYVVGYSGTTTGFFVPTVMNVATVNQGPPGPPPDVTQVIGQVPDGDGWKTTLLLVNQDLQNDAKITLRFWPSRNTQLGVLGFEGRPPLANLTLNETVPKGGVLTLRTLGTDNSPLWVGWAEVLGPSTVGGTAIFQKQLSPAQYSEAAVPMKVPDGRRFLIAFDNTDIPGFPGKHYSTGIAMLNTDDAGTFVQMTAKDVNGNPLPVTANWNLRSKEHVSLNTYDEYVALQGKRGVLEFISSNTVVSGLGLRFNPQLAFTSFDSITSGRPALQRIAQIAEGGGSGEWRTTITLVNTDANSPTTASIRFRPGLGTPAGLALPLEGSPLGVSSMSIPIPAGGSTVIQTAGAPGVLWQGWAEIQGNSIGGFAVFRQHLSDGADAEGSVPLVAAGLSKFSLPFEVSADITTAVAVADARNAGGFKAQFRDTTGTPIVVPQVLLNRALDPSGHDAFTLGDRYQLVPPVSGVVDFKGLGDLAAVGLRFNLSRKAFTSLPLLIAP